MHPHIPVPRMIRYVTSHTYAVADACSAQLSSGQGERMRSDCSAGQATSRQARCRLRSQIAADLIGHARVGLDVLGLIE